MDTGKVIGQCSVCLEDILDTDEWERSGKVLRHLRCIRSVEWAENENIFFRGK